MIVCRHRRASTRVLLLGILLVLFGCQNDRRETGLEDVSEPVPGGTAVVALSSEPDVLNPLIRTSAVAGTVLSLIQAGLLEMAEDLSWEPMIAESWEVAPDSLSVTYHLRPWRWEDGVPLTSADVRLTYELLRDERVGSPRADLWRDIQRVSTPDPQTIVYHFAQPVVDPLSSTAHTIVPRHLVVDRDPADVASWPLNRAPLASGPFRLESWEAGSELVLSRNPMFPGRAAHLERVILRVMPDETARILALESGEADLVYDVPANAARRLATHADLRLHEIPGRVFGFLLWNVRRPQLQDPAVRSALSLAIDRERFVNDLLGGYASPAASCLPPVLWNHDPNLAVDPFRPDSAAARLTAAGWQDRDGDGVRERDGVPLAIEVIYRSGDSVRENGAVVVQQNLTAIGVRVTLRALELATAVQFLRDGRFDAYFGEYQANLYADPSPLVRSGATDRFNYGGYANTRVDSLLVCALREPDRRRAMPLWVALQAELAADQPATMIYYPRQITATSARLRNVRPHMLSPVNNLDEWWIPRQERRWVAGNDSQ